MPRAELATIEPAGAIVLEHPAVRAWNQLRPGGPEPEAVETLHRRNKAAVYRLQGAGPEGSDVIAKRSFTASARIEHTVYQEILPRLPMPSLRCYGLIEDEDPEFNWLFMEDAGTESYLPALAEHRAMAARWLANLHTSAECLEAASCLPERGPAYYLEHL